MKRVWREADGKAEVREAVASWRESGAIDAAAAAAADARWPAEGPRLSLLWRALLFFFVSGAVQSAFTFTVLLLGELNRPERYGIGTIALLWGIALAVVTEVVLDRTRFAAAGAAGATALAASLLLVAGPLILLVPDGVEWQLARIIAAWAAVVLAGAAWRWGMWPLAGASAVALLVFLGTFPSGRALWIVAAALAAWGGSASAGNRELPRPHRWSAEAVLAVAVAAVALAVNPYSLDHAWIEAMEARRNWQVSPDAAVGPMVRAMGALATGLIPVLLLAWGARTRRRTLIDLAIVTGAAGAVTIRAYWHIADLWLVLAGSGTLLLLASLALVRWLSRGEGQERWGLTGEPLFNDRRREALLPIAAALAATPDARAIEQKPGFGGQGGDFGGGGAQAGF